MSSTTRLIANKNSLANPAKKAKIDELLMLMKAVLDARERVMLEMNIANDKFKAIVQELPCMHAPTVSPLYNNEGFAVKIAIKKSESIKLIPKLKRMGATDILEYQTRKVTI